MRKIRNNPAILKNALANVAWKAVINSSQQDLSKLVNFLTQTLNFVLDQLAPVKDRIIRAGTRPKLDKETLALIAKKKRLRYAVR